MILTKENVKSINLDRLTNDYVSGGKLNKLLVVVPTNRRLRRLKKEIISGSPGGSVSAINIETLSTLSSKLLAGITPFIPLSEGAGSILLEQSVEGLDLKYFSSYQGEIPHGTLEKIKNVISEYKRHGITPDRLSEEAEKLEGSEKLKAKDIALIYTAYLERCEQLKAYETGDVYHALLNSPADEVEKVYRELYPEVETVALNGFDEFSLPEIRIIDFITTIPGTRLFLDFDYYKYNPMIFSHLDESYEKLETYGFVKIEDASPAASGKFKSLVRSGLFLNKSADKESSFKDNLVFIKAASREEEISLIAREIKELIVNQGVKPGNICLAFNLIQKYSPIIRHTFEKYGIPYNLTDRLYLNRSYAVTSLISFLEILENDFFYRNIFRALSGGFISVDGSDVSSMKYAASELKIVSGRNNWLYTLKNEIYRLEKTEAGNEPGSRYKLERCKKSMDSVNKIYSLLEPFNAENTAEGFMELLRELIVKLKLPERMLSFGDGKEEENVKAVVAFLETIDEVLNLLTLENGKDKTYSFEYFIELIRTVAGWTRFNVKERSEYGVQVTTVNEIRGLSFDHLFLAGLNDGDFPTRFMPEIFFSGSFVRSEVRHQTEERYHFYQALSSWNKKLYLSAPAAEDRTELVESNFTKDFLTLFETSEKSSSGYKSKIYSKDDLLVFAGTEGLAKTRNAYKDNNLGSSIDFLYLEKAASVDKLRNSEPFSESVYNGFLLSDFTYGESQIEFFDTENTLTTSARRFLEEYVAKPFSISRLETYAKCPFSFFTESLLGLETEAEPTEEMEAVELGSLLHSILFEFFTACRKKGLILPGCSDAVFNKAEELIFNIAEEKIEEFAFNFPAMFYEREKILGLNGERKESVLYKVLENERNDASGMYPKFFEVSFGMPQSSENDAELGTALPLEIDGVKIRGKIDRIDLNQDKSAYSIIDYKTGGKKPSVKDLQEGLSLQLPVYLHAAGLMLKDNLASEPEPEDMTIYSLKYSEKDFGKKPVSPGKGDKKEKTIEQIEISKGYMKKYAEDIKNGRFNLSPHDNRENLICRFCEFKSVCRISEIK